MTLTAGTRLGPYEILSPLGAGGMGEVYRARDERLKRDVAIKVLPASVTGDPDRLRRFEVEAQAAGGLNHPNITAVYDIGSHDGAPYVVQELLEGETLRAELARGRLSTRRVVTYAIQVAEGLAAAHEKGIVHRDLKPENLFVTKDGRVKILDFGLAKLTQPVVVDGGESTPTISLGTEPGMVMGTVGYMSPEQVRGQSADHRSDIFSLGTTLYEMASGVRPFRGYSPVETMNAILKEEPPALTQTGRDFAPGLERLIWHCLEKNPAQRFQSARDLAYDFGAISDTSAPTRDGRVAWGRRSSPRSGWTALTLAGLAAGVLAGLWLGARTSKLDVLSFHRLTFRRGRLLSARFAPDGKTVAYAASWEGAPAEVFTVRTDTADSHAIGLSHADVFAVSSKGELAVRMKQGTIATWPFEPGTLARLSIGGGTPRELLENVVMADWGPNGEDLAVLRKLPNFRSRVEYPVGSVLYESLPGCDFIRVSPNGERVACEEWAGGSDYTISTIDRKGKKVQVSGPWGSLTGLAWSPRGDRLLFVAGRTLEDRALREVTLAGRERVIVSNASDLWLDDVGPDGSLLVERRTSRHGLRCLSRGATAEREIGWLDRSLARDITEDGSAVLFTELGEGAGSKAGTYLRKTDGSAAIRLGDGEPGSLSSDDRWVLSLLSGPPRELVMYPVGAGLARKVPIEGAQPIFAYLLPKDRGILMLSAAGARPQFSVVGLEGGKPRTVRTEGLDVDHTTAASPDGERLAYGSSDGKLTLAPIFEGSVSTVPGFVLERNDIVEQWSGDGRFVYLSREDELPNRVDRVELSTGRREPWKSLMPADSAGVYWISHVTIAPDGQSYVYAYTATVSSALYVLRGVK